MEIHNPGWRLITKCDSRRYENDRYLILEGENRGSITYEGGGEKER